MAKDQGEDRPFEEKAAMFGRAVQALGLQVSGDAEYDLREYGRLVVEYHSLKTDDERNEFKEKKMSPMYDRLGKASETNDKVGNALVELIFAESLFS